MAITIVQHPGTTSSLYSPMWHRVTSTNVAQPNFRYVFDIVIGGNLVITLRVIPINTEGLVDVSRVIHAYVSNYFAPTVTTPPLAINTARAAVAYAINYKEEYGPVGSVLPSGTLATGNYAGINAYNTPTPGAEPYKPWDGYSYKWLTSRDINNIQIPKTGSAFISYLNANGAARIIRVQQLDINGNGTGTIYESSELLTGTAFELLEVYSLGASDVSAASFPGTAPDVGSWPYGYRLQLGNVPFDIITAPDPAWLYVKWLCTTGITVTPVTFLNRFGGFDTFHFSGPARNELTVEAKTFERIPMIDRGNTYREYDTQNNVYADTVIPYHTEQSWTRKLVSGYLSQQDYDWLSQLLASPQVFITEGGYTYPVTLGTRSWQQKLTRYDKMFNLEIEVKLGRQITSQSR